MMAALPIDVVIVTWNSRDMVLRCLDRFDPARVQKIIVVDNGSSDGTAAAVREQHRSAELVRLVAGSFAAAYNQGADRGSAEFVLFLNDDVLVTDASIATLVETLQAHPGAVAAAGRLVDPRQVTPNMSTCRSAFRTLPPLRAPSSAEVDTHPRSTRSEQSSSINRPGRAY